MSRVPTEHNPQDELAANGHCRYCGVVLNRKGAAYCSSCNHWQFRGSFLVPYFNPTDIALYGSVIVLLFSSFSDIFVKEKASLHGTPVRCHDYEFTVYVSNDGNYRAVLTGASLRIRVGDSLGDETSVSLLTDQKENVTISVAPSAGDLITLKVEGYNLSAFTEEQKINAEDCYVTGQIDAIVNASGEKNPLEIAEACRCRDFTRTL